MKNFVQPGDTLSLTAPYAVASGAGMLVGALFAVAVAAADNGAPVEGKTTGVFELAKVEAQAWTQGARLYWDAATKLVTTVAAGNTLIGTATEAADNPSTTGLVRLNPSVPELPEGSVAANVAALTENTGALGGTNNGDLPDLTATAATVTGTLTGTTDGAMEDIADIALSTSNTYTDAAVNAAVNAAILSANLQLKELQAALNEAIADNVALRAAVRENAAKVNALLSALVDAGHMAAS